MSLEFDISDLSEVFADLAPVPQDDGPSGVAAIDYSPNFVKAFDYLRAVWKVQEKSKRAIRLTTLCLEQNPANYTVWHFRRQCLEKLDLWREYLERDMDLAADLGGLNPKNYQIWYHRRRFIEKMLELASDEAFFTAICRQELKYIRAVVKEDGKNYHAWSQRQFVVRTLAASDDEIWKTELVYTQELLEKDVRNNSAWNHRWFVCHQAHADRPLDEVKAAREVDFAIELAKLDPYNESPFRYVAAAIKEQTRMLQDASLISRLLLSYQTKLQSIVSCFEEKDEDARDCPNLVSAQVDLWEWMGDRHSLEQASAATERLHDEVDPIRAKYWEMRRGKIQARLGS